MTKKYTVNLKVDAITARELILDYLNPEVTIPKPLQSAVNDGRLRFFSKIVQLRGHIVDRDDYIVIGMDDDITAVSKEFFEQHAEIDE